MKTINPLPMIQLFILEQQLEQDEIPIPESIPREKLRDWLTRKIGGKRGISRLDQLRIDEDQVELALDCLAAAGIGREVEQSATVYCRASYS